jgi:hypothetical protein
MPKRLSLAQIERYWEEGCVFPIRVMSEADAVEHRALLEEFERRTGGPLKGPIAAKKSPRSNAARPRDSVGK